MFPRQVAGKSLRYAPAGRPVAGAGLRRWSLSFWEFSFSPVGSSRYFTLITFVVGHGAARAGMSHVSSRVKGRQDNNDQSPDVEFD